MNSAATTQFAWTLRGPHYGNAADRQNVAPVPPPAPPKQLPTTTAKPQTADAALTGPALFRGLQPIETLASLASRPLDTAPDSVELEVWEGVVLEVDPISHTMQVTLEAKNSNIEPHTAKISFEYVADQDEDLVRPGAVFYLMLYNQTVRGTIYNIQNLRFRRRPDWSKKQIESIELDAKRLAGKINARPANA
jgi:hypothetical protein